MNAFLSSAHCLRYVLCFALSILFFGSVTFALPLGAICETQNCDAGLICKNSNGQTVPPGLAPGSCVIQCNNNNFCDSGESVQYCADCHCGNGMCEPAAPWSENKTNCGADCYCGNGTVEVGENNCTCPADVPATTCGDGCCRGSETSQSCSSDCGLQSSCGNNTVDPGETFCTCPQDVQSTTCGDGCCAQGESVNDCYQDCGSCGDGQCNSPETLSTCPSDCHVCGDGECTAPWEAGTNCVDCQVPSCSISGPAVCRNNTYTFDCNHYYTNGPISMSNSNPNQTSQTDSITVSIGPNAQGVTTISCFDNGDLLCSKNRTIGYCGDGVTNCSEQCDYGNSFPNACNPTSCTWKSCTTTADCGSSLFVCNNGLCDAGYCGDGILSLGEQCEQNSDCAGYGNGYTCDGCYCSIGVGGGGGTPICGNNITETGEQCDDGDSAHPGQGGTITDMDTCDGATCTKVNVCGDGIIGAGEQCDNGGKCTRSPSSSYPPLSSDLYCNEESDCNSILNAVCAPRAGDGCSETCQNEPGWVCGDGIAVTAAGEDCDDGNAINGDGCDNNCTTTACGNGIVTGTEECDDGNSVSGDGCSDTCQGAFCGDGILQERGADGQVGGGDDEVCDDGNSVSGDGCTADCSYCGLHCPDCSVKLPNLDIFFVVDTSDSMLEGSDGNTSCADGVCKLIDAKTAIELFVNALNPAEDRVALIDFNTTATVRYGLAANTGFSSMITAINALQATGLTNMGAAMSALSSFAGGYSYSGRVPVVIFLSDGVPTLPNSPDPVTYTKTQADTFHDLYPEFKVYSVGLDFESLTPTNQATAIDLLQNYIASSPSDFYIGAPGGKGAVCGGGVGSDGAAIIGGGGFGSESLAGLGLSETYGQIRGQMCQCGLTPPTPVCSGGGDGGTTRGGTSAGLTAGGGVLLDTINGTPKSGFCSGNSKLSCSTNSDCGTRGPCIMSNNLCGGREWYSCEGGTTCEGCGDGILQTGEQCDAGSANGTIGAGCDAFCKLTTYCGDGIVQDCEVCDDGNFEPGDGCSPRCTKETIVCGDSVVNACGVLTGAYLASGDEEGFCSEDPTIACNAKGINCPAGKGVCLEGTYCNLGVKGTCLHDPTVTCTSNFECVDQKTGIGVCVGLALAQIPDPSNGGPIDLKEICGGGSEFCDDGNTVGGDSCPANCTSVCGDGVVEGNEGCDDGNTINTDACTNTCSAAYCGDGIVRLGVEQCDDGKNGDNSDGCTDQCTTGVCDPTTTYASGAIPGWFCPVGWILQGCPGSYLCVRQSIAPIICTECGNGTKDPTEECDWSDPADPLREGCNQYCLLNYCGDGEIFTGSSTGSVWNRTLTGSTSLRPMLTFSRVITQGQGGFTTILESGAGDGSSLGKTMTVLNDIDGNGINELAVSLHGHDVNGQINHGQIMSLSFDTGGKVDAERVYFSGTTLGSQFFAPLFLESIGNIENSIFGAGTFPVHKEFIFSTNKTSFTNNLLGLFIGKYPTYVGNNTGSVSLQGFASTQITDLATIGDLDNNGVDDLAVLFLDGSETKIAVILLTGNPVLQLSTQIISGIGLTGVGQGKLSPMGDTDSDGVEDVMVSWYTEASGQMVLKRVLLNTSGTLKSQSTFHTMSVNKAAYSYAVYGEDVDEDGTKDIVTVRSRDTPYILDGLLLRMNSNWTVKAADLLDFGASKAQGDTQYFPHEALFLPDFDADGDETIAIGSPTSFSHKGAIYTYELQAPYGHELTGGGTIEECDAGSFCDDLTTRCDDNPSICAGGPAHCLPRYINGCTPFCQLGCGDGVVDVNGLDGLPNTADDEICDDGNGIDTDACTNSCQRPSCGDGILTDETGRTGQNGLWTGYFEMCDPGVTGGVSCPNTCVLTGGVNARCNYTFASASAYDVVSFSELQALPGSLCYPVGVGVIEGTHTYNASGVVTARNWSCEGIGSGASSSCSLARWGCGDGVVDTWLGTNAEECDDGNTTSNDGCSATCQREDILVAPSQQCTVGSYPQIEEGEYLPAWWVGERSDSVGSSTITTCDATTPSNMIIRKSILCHADIQRGDPSGGGSQLVKTEIIPCGVQATGGVGLISGAIADFAPGITLSQTLGSYLFSTGQVSSWVNYSGNRSYGQYKLGVKEMDMTYCALRRTSSIGTVTGTVTTLSDYEDCQNNVDDNGDGVIDCADTVRCNATLHPHCDPNGGGGLPEDTAALCTDNFDNDGDGNIDCADAGCHTFAHCNDVLPENCRTTIDEDGDGLGGCDDPSCQFVPYCMAYQTNSPESSFTTCTDGVDNDGDGFFDCNDPNCLSTVGECMVPLNANYCIDGLNNEPRYNIGGGQVANTTGDWLNDDGSFITDKIYGTPVQDGKDPQCFLGVGGQGYYSKESNCYDGLDNNNALQIDCQDPTCQFFNVCGEYPFTAQYGNSARALQPVAESTNCGDGIDNDGDGWIDCADYDCKDKPILCLGVPQGGGVGEDCLDGVDNDGDGFVDCADGECVFEQICKVGDGTPGTLGNEDCFDTDANGLPRDNDGDGLANILDPDCYQFYGTGYQAPVQIGSRTPGMVTYTATGAMCEAGFSISKGYFVQQGFAFSEQANTGLDTASFTSIGGISLVAEGTAIDDSLNQVATYQGGGKQYLFDDFIDTWSSKAVNKIAFTLNGRTYTFLKVPSTQIYFYDGTTPATVLIDDDVKERLLLEGNVAGADMLSTAVTIVLPELGQKLVINGSVHGNNLFIAKGDIKFASSLTEGCDGSDIVEGLFVAGGSFETDTIGNKNINQDKRCKGGNLQIKGTLLGLNAGSQLAPLRRSVLNAWGSGDLLFDQSKIFQAKELFETCYLPNLLYKVFGNTATGPMAGCDVQTYNTKKPASLTYMKTSVLNTFREFLEVAEYYMANECTLGQPCDPVVEKFINSLPNKPVTNNDPNIPAQSIIFLREGTYGSPLTWNVSFPAMEYIDSRGKVLPLRMVPNPGGTHTVDLTNPLIRRQMVEYLSKYVGDIKSQFLSFPSLDGLAITANLGVASPLLKSNELSTLYGKLSAIWGSPYTLTFNQPNKFLKNTCDYCVAADATQCKAGSYNKFICSPDMKFLTESRSNALTENSNRQDKIVEGSSVVILSNPSVRTELPPGAKDFLNSLSIVPN